jgi:streptogramin lyase
MVTYTKQSGFIREFDVPIQELGLKGIITDNKGNVWVYHSTDKTSSIFRFDSKTESFTPYDIVGDTIVETPIINLAGGQLTFDESRNIVWFTDARTNSIGKLYVDEEKIELIPIPTPRSGPMGIALSPDHKDVWFAEIIGDKIAKLDIESGRISEYSTGKETGPTLLVFDEKGILWVTSSYSNNVFRVQPSVLDSVISSGITSLTLPKPDSFSPFGIAVIEKNGTQKIFVSDHGSSRIIYSDTNLQSYTSYWTSPSKIYPTTLPSQMVIDNLENIYFVQHGGNRISKLDVSSGIMTEYDIPTGPLSTVVYLSVSGDGRRVWFTEWAANKIGYLDTETSVQFELQIDNDQAKLQRNTPYDMVALVTSEIQNSPISLSSLGIAVVGMSDGGLKGITYSAAPQWLDMTDDSQVTSKITLEADSTARGGKHTLMVRVSAFEKDNLMVSKLVPVSVVLDPTDLPFNNQNMADTPTTYTISPQETRIFLALGVVVGLIGLLMYNRLKRTKRLEN